MLADADAILDEYAEDYKRMAEWFGLMLICLLLLLMDKLVWECIKQFSCRGVQRLLRILASFFSDHKINSLPNKKAPVKLWQVPTNPHDKVNWPFRAKRGWPGPPGRSSLETRENFLIRKATAETKISIYQNNIKYNSLKYKHNAKFKTKKRTKISEVAVSWPYLFEMIKLNRHSWPDGNCIGWGWFHKSKKNGKGSG